MFWSPQVPLPCLPGCDGGHLVLLPDLPGGQPGAGHLPGPDLLPHHPRPQVRLLRRLAQGEGEKSNRATAIKPLSLSL